MSKNPLRRRKNKGTAALSCSLKKGVSHYEAEYSRQDCSRDATLFEQRTVKAVVAGTGKMP